MKDSELLIQARGLIDTPDRWGKAGKTPLRHPPERRCLLDALVSVIDHNSVYHTTYRRLRDLLGQEIVEQGDFWWRDVPGSWNDADATTHQDVMNVYDKAIAKLEEAGK
jgi:hypothetical protein